MIAQGEAGPREAQFALRGEAKPWVGFGYESRVGFNRRHIHCEGVSPSER
jgi:hypothetical protein